MPPRRKPPEEALIVGREFTSVEEIDRGIKKLERRIGDVEALDVRAAVLQHTGADDVVESDIRETIREVFGPDSPELKEHAYIRVWAGPMGIGMDREDVIEARKNGKVQITGILRGLVKRLQEKREDLGASLEPSPRSYFERLNLHPRIADVANDLYLDGYYSEAVFAAAKALVNYVKERSGLHELDGAPLMRTAFSKNKPVLGFNELKDQTDQDEQEGMMHLFEGAVLGIRNPGGHSFPEGTEQRALEYISFLSLLAYRVQEAKRRRPEGAA